MKHIVVATKNPGKADEFKQFFQRYDIQTQSLLDMDETMPDIEETGNSFMENAALKAEGLSTFLGETVISDDSGLMIDALGGEPGIFSARYSSLETDAGNIQKVLEQLTGVPTDERTARFVCVLAVASPHDRTVFKTGYCEGHITTEPLGKNGFGYDPIFIPEGYTWTMAQLSQEEKNRISHRNDAFNKLAVWLT